jgi:hypothetical protein
MLMCFGGAWPEAHMGHDRWTPRNGLLGAVGIDLSAALLDLGPFGLQRDGQGTPGPKRGGRRAHCGTLEAEQAKRADVGQTVRESSEAEHASASASSTRLKV